MIEEMIKELGYQDIVIPDEAKKALQEANISDEELAKQFNGNKHRIQALLQLVVGRCSPAILNAAWKIILFWRIKSINFQYREQELFEITLCIGNDDKEETIKTTNLDDFSLLRHIGKVRFDNKPVLDGCYPLRLKDKQ